MTATGTATHTTTGTATGVAPRTAALSDLPQPSGTARALRYAMHTSRMTLTNVFFMAFSIAMPVGMYLLFGTMFGDQADGTARGMIMVNMAAYGGLGTAITAGTQIQEDQRNGFLRQLIVAGLSPRSFLIGSVLAASVVIVPALLAVGVVGLATGVEADPLSFLATIAVLWLGLLPTILIGIALGMLLTGGAASAGGVVTLMGMAVLGGLWLPLEMFPDWMQSIGKALPSHWIAKLGTWALYGGELPVTGLLVIGIWTLVLGVICAVSLNKAIGLTRR